MKIIKSNGKKVNFNPNKLIKSLEKSKDISSKEIYAVIMHVVSQGKKEITIEDYNKIINEKVNASNKQLKS